MTSITSANSILMIGVTDLYPVAQKIEGYSADEMFDWDMIQNAEAQMGVDGRLTGGWVASALRGTLTLQADSPSNDFFDSWNRAQKEIKDLYFGFAILTLPSLGKKFTLTKGILTDFNPIPSAAKIMRPRKYNLTWETYDSAPT